MQLGKYILLFFVLISPNTLFGQWFDKGGKEIPDSEWRKTKQNFSCMLLLSSKPDQFLKAWGHPVDGFSIHTTDEITKGNTLTVYIMFLGCPVNQAGLCNTVADYTILKPDGSIYANVKNAELWQGKKPMGKGKLGLGVDYLELKIEPKDPLGVYIIKTAIKDLNTNITLELERPITVLKSAK